ncbi:MAG: hypothetical protein HKO63_06990 [Acidimicrobiia bacterium]|nr:hypothetical protein [Acidimicrobiia bacterium]
MSEHEIQSAFDRLERDVVTSVRTGERLEHITGRPRLRRRPAVAALVGAAVVVLVVGGGVLLVLPDDDRDPSPPATVGSTTSMVESTTTTTAGVPTTLLPEPPLGSVLIADMDVLALQQGDGYIAYLAERVVGDGSGGVVVQLDNRLIRITPAGEGGDLIDGDDWGGGEGPVAVRLEDIALVDGSPRVLFVVSGGTLLDSYEEAWSYDLESGSSALLYTLEPAFESTITRVSQVDDLVVLSSAFEGGSSFEFLNADGDRVDVTGPYADRPGGAPEYPTYVDQAVLSPDGSTMAYVEGEYPTGADQIVDIVMWDLATGTELRRVPIELTNGAWPGRLDYDGVGVVLGRTGNVIVGVPFPTPLHIESLADGIVTELPELGSPSLVKFDRR